jgi:hypothetical protein
MEEVLQDLVDALKRSTCTADALLTAKEVAAVVRWRETDCREWLRAQGLARRRPGSRTEMYRWGDVLTALPTELERQRSEPDEARLRKRARSKPPRLD